LSLIGRKSGRRKIWPSIARSPVALPVRRTHNLGAGIHMKGRVLVVDDEADARTALGELLRGDGYLVETAADGFKALAKVQEFAPDVVLTDLRMPGMHGVDLLKKLRADDPDLVVLVMTAFNGDDSAVAALREGAAGYFAKPLNVTELSFGLGREMERLRLRREAGQLRARLAERYSFERIIGSAPVMQTVFKTVAQVASSRASILVTGESGTGKELIAAAIHERSPRADKPFVKLHCGALAETLLESELFGHERGAFTGAAGRRVGRFVQADGGTLFLDEIGDISPTVQVKLLRFLQEHELERVGGNETLRVDVRVIAATNRDLHAEVAAGRFREDLFYRLNVINIEMPALRQRRSDICVLASHFLRQYALENGKTIEGFADEAVARLSAYDWPGNVRELENVVERAVVLSRGPRITSAELPPNVAAWLGDGPGVVIPGSSMADIERHAVLKTLEATGGSTTKAAAILGMSVRAVQYRMQKYASAPKDEPRAAALALVESEQGPDLNAAAGPI
jgi:DNA-binding NtrC family response regulator